jgi:hypothetical protein
MSNNAKKQKIKKRVKNDQNRQNSHTGFLKVLEHLSLLKN